MKICFISHTSNLGGAERSLLYLLESIKKEKGLEIFVVVPSEGPMIKYLREMKINYLIHPFKWWTIKRNNQRRSVKEHFVEHLRTAFDLKQKLKNNFPDLIVSNTSVFCVGALMANMLKVPHLWHIRELGEEDHGFIFEFELAFVARFINDFSTKVIFNSRAVMSEFSKYKTFNNSSVIYNSILIKKRLLSEPPKTKFAKNNSFKLLVAGTISRKKNQLDAIKATISLLKEGYNVELLLVGDCADKILIKRIHSLIDSDICEERIKIHEFVENPYPLFKNANAVIVCSKKEAFGRIILEGMLLKKPVIATNSGGIPEIIIHNYNGLLYKPRKYIELAEMIKTLIDDPELYKLLAKNGYEVATNKFSNKNYSYKMLKIFKQTQTFFSPPSIWRKKLYLSKLLVKKYQLSFRD